MKTLIFAMMLALLSSLYGNDSGLIYGKVTTIDGDKFEGNIRWGKEEAMWMDFFNSEKEENEFEDFEPENRRHKNKKRKYDFNIGGFKINNFSITTSGSGFGTNHIFATMFGDIKEIKMRGDEEALVVMKSGKRYNFDGASNDLGSLIKVYDRELGEVKLRWDRVDNVVFEDTPSSLSRKFGSPLYGKVETDGGDFEGYIIWDKDERLSSDKLDGDTRNGELSIEFGSIKSIERDGRGSLVVTKSGREFYLKNSNDVNGDNRGIVVNIPDFGRVTSEWREFRKVTFMDDPDKLPEYDDFDEDIRAKGIVRLKDGDTHEGIIAYDLDETWGFEMIDGTRDDIKYNIPIRYIDSVKPKNFNYSIITLKSGKKIEIGDERDVSDDNGGVLIIKDEDDKDAYYAEWDEIEEIFFK
jgi:hypothetical protein